MGAGASAEKKEGATAKLAAIGAFAQPPPPPAAAVSPPADDLADPDPDPAAAALPGSGGGGGGSEGGAAVPSPEEHPPVCKARALYDLEAEHPEDLVLRKGQIVFVDEIPPEGSQGGEWWRGRVLRGGRYESGIFPRSYVERLPEEEDERGGDEVRAAGPASVSSHDEYDDLVHLINTDGPQPDFTPAASGLVAAAAAAVPALEDPAGRGFVECPTLKLFRAKCSTGKLGRVVTVDAKKQAALMSHYFSDAAVDRQVQERTDRATVLEAAKAYLAQFSSSRDAWEIQKALNRHAVLGLAVQQERTLLERRILKLVARARTRMTDALVLSAPPDDCMKAIAKYGHWPQVEAEKKALVRFLDDAVVNAYNLLDIAGINTVLDIYDCSKQFTATALTGLRAHRKRQVELLQIDLKGAVGWDDPREINRLLIDAEACRDEVEPDRTTLENIMLNFCEVNIGRIEPLIGSEDFVAVEAMLLRYQGFPDRVKPTWDTLRQHRDKLLTLAKQALLALLDSHDLGLMERTFALYLAYAEAVAVERDRAVAHHDFVLEQAPILLAAAAADLQSTVAHMVLLVNRYAAYDNCGTERQSVVDVLIGRMAAFLSMRDVRPLAAAVAEFEVARQTMPREYAALAGHYEDLAVPMVQRLTEVLAKAVALEEEAALAASDGYGYEVEDLRGRLAVQLAGHVDDAVGEMQVHTNGPLCSNVTDIDRALVHYTNYTLATAESWAALRAHRDRLQEAARSELVQLLGTEDVAVLVVSLEKHVPYVGLEREHTALKEWWRKLIMVETLQKHIEIFEFGPVEECLIGYAEDVKQMGGGPAGGTSDRAVEAWKGLREHRDHLVELAKVELVAVISESVMENVKACLEKHVVYGKHVEEERALVTERMSYLQKRVDLYDLRGSDDFKAIDTAIVDYQDDDDPHIRALIPPLEERATQLAKAVKMALSELVEYVAPVAMGNALKRYADYQRMCPREYAAVSVRRDELCQDAAEAIAVALARKQPMSRKELEEMLKKYKSYPPELMNGQLALLRSVIKDAIATAKLAAAKKKERMDRIKAMQAVGQWGATGKKQPIKDSKWVDQKMKDRVTAMKSRLAAEEAMKEAMNDSGDPEAGPASDSMKAAAEEGVMDGVEAVLSGDMRVAVDNFLASLKQNPKDAVCAYNLACCFGIMKEPKTAVSWFGKSIEWGIAGHSALDNPAGDADFSSMVDFKPFQRLCRQLDRLRGKDIPDSGEAEPEPEPEPAVAVAEAEAEPDAESGVAAELTAVMAGMTV